MHQDNSHTLIDNLLYSCVDKVRRGSEQFVKEHSLGYIIAGETHIHTNSGVIVFAQGGMGIARRNQLIKSTKVPPANGGDYKSININFSQDFLRRYSAENNIPTSKKIAGNNFTPLPDDPFLKGYFNSLTPYFEHPGQLTSSLAQLKTKEALELILRINPDLKDILFDFTDPHKIDLEAFMESHYTYNVSTHDFAKLTGRSLASFKRDFQKIYRVSPRAWLQQKRLAEAYYLIKEKNIKPSIAYLDVGFENLSHFSFAFKKMFGVAPSLV